jgi:uncharacterized protein (TIGR00369 family)
MIAREPVRGAYPEPSFYGQSGLDQMRGWLRTEARVPLSHLVGFRPVQASAGSLTATTPATGWLTYPDGTLDVQIVLEFTAMAAAITGAPSGHEPRTVLLSVNHLRATLAEGEALVARARIVHSGRTFTFVEAQVEDGLGRPTAVASASIVLDAIDPPPPPRSREPAPPVETPTYSTPDPYLRPLPQKTFPYRAWLDTPGLKVIQSMLARTLPEVPIHHLLGVEVVDCAEGMFAATLPASEWMCGSRGRVQPGILGAAFTIAMSGAALTTSPGGRNVGVLGQSVNFLRPIPPDGRALLVRAAVIHRGGELVVVQGEITDEDGNRVALGHQTVMLVEPRRGPTAELPSERTLTTVLFTDLVNSTAMAERLGDQAWRERLDEHNAVVRRQIALSKGREVKTIGDSFMATFNTPAGAVQCARAIRDGLRRIGLEVRIGIHTGECEVVGSDLTGIAVVVASRIQSAAAGGEILVSSTVRELVTGSGLRFADHGRHSLKGIEGEWQVFEVAD